MAGANACVRLPAPNDRAFADLLVHEQVAHHRFGLVTGDLACQRVCFPSPDREEDLRADDVADQVPQLRD